MIRAVVKNGVIHPMDPLPAAWNDGRTVVIEELDEATDTLEQWAKDMNALTADLDDPAEWERMEATLAEADRQAKGQVRKEMGLS